MNQALLAKTVSLGFINDASSTAHASNVDNARLLSLCGERHRHIQILEQELGVQCHQQGGDFVIEGNDQATQQCAKILRKLYELTNSELNMTESHVYDMINQYSHQDNAVDEPNIIKTPLKTVVAKSKAQSQYLSAIDGHDVILGVGPAGTGKTYLAVAKAVESLMSEQVKRIVLVRPVVEAGENLGFLPGDIGQKIDPYLRPLYDALYEFLGTEKVNKLIEQNVIELAPLAYMRGRTLSDAFIIMDEAQNTTAAQMKMLLTRLGYGAKAVVNGDLSQVDLPKGTMSGLKHAVKVLKGVRGIYLSQFTGKDIVRHALVQRIVEAYENKDA